MRTKLASGKLWLIILLLLSGLFLTSQVMAYDTQAQVTAPAIVNASSATVHANADTQATIVDVVSLNQVDAHWAQCRRQLGLCAHPQQHCRLDATAGIDVYH